MKEKILIVGLVFTNTVERGSVMLLKKMSLIVLLSGCFFGMLVGAVASTEAQAASKIAFSSNRDGNWEIYVMDADGSNQTNLTNNSSDSREARWSPDGTQIAFSSNRDGDNMQIYVMDADGSNPTRLTDNYGDWARFPAWSPDGTQIGFSSSHGQMYVMDADGSYLTPLTDDELDGFDFQWSPDGTQIVFSSDRDGNYEIYVMDADGSNQTNFTNNSQFDVFPTWSPDGTRIAFSSTFWIEQGVPNQWPGIDIYVMDGQHGHPPLPSSLQDLTDGDNGSLNMFSVWSPDGAQIAFTSNRDGNEQIYVMDADGSNPTRLTDNFSGRKEGLSWSPDLSIPVPSISPLGQFAMVLILGGITALWMTKRNSRVANH